jgi:hypothetical protein
MNWSVKLRIYRDALHAAEDAYVRAVQRSYSGSPYSEEYFERIIAIRKEQWVNKYKAYLDHVELCKRLKTTENTKTEDLFSYSTAL